MVRCQLSNDTQLIQREFAFPALSIDARQLEVRFDMRRMALQAPQAEPERSL
jgi:hypothetical protein